MSDDWDSYLLLVDNEPASIFLDLGLVGEVPLQSQPHMSYVRVFMLQPRPDGLSSNEEFDDLIAVEDSLSEVFDGNETTTYVGRNTSSGNRDFYFYTDDVPAFAETVEAAMKSHPQYQFEVGDRLDPSWDVYLNFLYPSPIDLQRILNRRVTRLLSANGDNLSEPRLIDHTALLPNAAAAQNLRDYLGGQNFSVEEPWIEQGSIVISFKRPDRPDDIDNVVIPIARRVQELGGAYDGWGCEAVK